MAAKKKTRGRPDDPPPADIEPAPAVAQPPEPTAPDAGKLIVAGIGRFSNT